MHRSVRSNSCVQCDIDGSVLEWLTPSNDLERETRVYGTRTLEYANREDPFAHYVQQAENAIGLYDDEMIAYAESISKQAE